MRLPPFGITAGFIGVAAALLVAAALSLADAGAEAGTPALLVAPTGHDYTWTHLAATYDGTTVKLYVNGQEAASRNVTGPLPTSTEPLRIGGDSIFPEWFDGLIDDVRVYDRALAPAEIQGDMVTPVATDSWRAGLVAGYAFDEGVGATVTDSSGNSHDGVVAGAAWTPNGHTGAALSFDGTDDWVTVPDAGALEPTAAMTLEAWVRPTKLGPTWRAVVLKEDSWHLDYGLYASTGTSQPSANVFMDGHVDARGDSLPGNSCPQSDPCLSLDRAYRAARPGDVVEVADGAYGPQRIEPDATKTAPPDVIFEPAPGASPTLGPVVVDGAQHLELRDLRIDGWHAFYGSDLTFRNITSPSLYVTSASHVRIIGGSYGPQTDYDDGQIRAACPSCAVPTDIVVDGARFHDATLSPGSDAHVECLQVGDVDGLTIRNSTFVNCQTHDVFISPWWTGLVRNVLLENNFGGPVRDGYFGFRIAAGDGTCDNVAFRYDSSVSTFLIQCGTVVNGASMVANVGPYVPWACYSNVTFDHNVWDGAACSDTDTNAPSDFVDPANSDLHLKTGAAAIGHGDPAQYPSTDIDGQTRPIAGAPDAGADEAG